MKKYKENAFYQGPDIEVLKQQIKAKKAATLSLLQSLP